MRREFNLIFWLGIVFFLGVSGLAGWCLLQLHNEIQLREETSLIEDKLGEVYDTLLEADVTFLILKNFQDENDVKKLLKLTKQARRQVNELSKMVHTTSNIHKDVLELREMVVEKSNLSEKLILNLDLEAPEPFERVLVLQDDLLLTHKVNEKIKSIEAFVVTNLEKHRAYVDRYFSLNMITIAGAVLMTFFFFLTFARLVFSEIERRQTLEKELRQAQEAAIQASNLKSQFLATVSHEIRTPLNGIIGMSELLRERVSGEAEKYTVILQNSGRTLLRIVNDILDFSKIEANKINFEIQEVKISHLLEAAIELFALQANNKKIILSCSYDLSLENIFATDGGRLSQILHNLINNALKFTEVGDVEVNARVVADTGSEIRAYFSVCDTGPGVAPDKAQLIFEPFYQTETHHQHVGTGLGLAISKKLVEHMGGKMGFTNRPKGGSQFWFEMPFRKIKDDQGMRTAIKVKSISQHQLAEPVQKFMNEFCTKNHIAYRNLESINSTNQLGDGDFLFTDVTTAEALADTASRFKVFGVSFSPFSTTKVINVLSLPLSFERLWRTLRAAPVSSLTSEIDSTANRSLTAPASEILLVEDNETNQILVKTQGEQLGYQMQVVADGQECLALLQTKNFGLILMDCRMPVMDGFEATRKIRELEARRGAARTPIIAMTANASEEDRQKCITTGMDDYLAKPFEIATLESMLKQWLPLQLPEVNWAVLEGLAKKMNGEVVLRLIESFKSSLAKSIVEFESFADEKKWIDFASSAHRLKSSAAALGAERLASLCQKAEDQQTQTDEVSAELVRQITECCRAALVEFKNQNRF
jgi:two-component system, sensor histidine kinase and response regulator